jgi:hypothetical protein
MRYKLLAVRTVYLQILININSRKKSYDLLTLLIGREFSSTQSVMGVHNIPNFRVLYMSEADLKGHSSHKLEGNFVSFHGIPSKISGTQLC